MNADATHAYRYLVDRAQEFVRDNDGSVHEDVLIRHVFGTVKSPDIWRSLFLTVAATAPDLRKKADGTWGFSTHTEQGETLLETFVAIDVETTGLKASTQRIIEVGAVRFRGGEVVESLSSLCDPEKRIPAFITKLTGIQQRDVVHAPSFEVLAPQVREFVGDAVVLGHNVQFDIRFLNAELKRAGFPALVNDRVDVMGLAMRLLPNTRRPSLDKVAKSLGLAPRTIHRAAGDAELAGRAALVLLQIAQDQGIESLDGIKRTAQLSGSRPKSGVGRARSVLDERHIREIPAHPGIYLMRDEGGRVIYVGKAKDLRKRVRSYYSQPLGYARKMDGLIESIERIDYEVTGTELEALLLEAQLIRRYQPRFNRAMRSHEHYPYIRVDLSNNWPRIHLASKRRNDGARYFGPFRSRRVAKDTVDLLNELYPLRTCPRSFKNARSLGSPCLRLDLGQCLGPCVGQANRDDYIGFVREAVAFLEGDDAVLSEHLQSQLQLTADQEDFESARKLRNAISTLQSISGAQRTLKDLSEHKWQALLLPSSTGSAVSMMLIHQGHVWAKIVFERQVELDDVLDRLTRVVDRMPQSGSSIFDHNNLDESLILGRWMQSNDGHPAIITIDSVETFSWESLIELAREYSYESFVSWSPEDDDLTATSPGSEVRQEENHERAGSDGTIPVCALVAGISDSGIAL